MVGATNDATPDVVSSWVIANVGDDDQAKVRASVVPTASPCRLTVVPSFTVAPGPAFTMTSGVLLSFESEEPPPPHAVKKALVKNTNSQYCTELLVILCINLLTREDFTSRLQRKVIVNLTKKLAVFVPLADEEKNNR